MNEQKLKEPFAKSTGRATNGGPMSGQRRKSAQHSPNNRSNDRPEVADGPFSIENGVSKFSALVAGRAFEKWPNQALSERQNAPEATKSFEPP